MYSDTIIKYLNDRRLIFSVTLLLTALLAYQLSILLWQVIPEPEMPRVNTSQLMVSNSQQSQTMLSARQKMDEIANSHLFGKVQQKQISVVEVQDAPESNLNYKVRGIYYSKDQSLASAILQKDSKTTKFYRLGDEVDSNIFIQQIQPDHILISRQGRLEKLILEKPKPGLSARSSRPVNNNLAVSSSAKVLKSYRRRYENNPMALAKRFQAIPVEENGRNIGYKLKALRGERLLQKLNLQKDDVFVEINGIGLDKPFQALDALKSLTTADNVSLTVLRNGNRETLDFNLK